MNVFRYVWNSLSDTAANIAVKRIYLPTDAKFGFCGITYRLFENRASMGYLNLNIDYKKGLNMSVMVKCTRGIDYPLLDSLSENAQRLYLFMLTQDGKLVDVDAYAAILHMTTKELCESVFELCAKRISQDTKNN